MDPNSMEQSMCMYYGFQCWPDTCATFQITKRTWESLKDQLFNLANYSVNLHYMLGTGSLYEGTFIDVPIDPSVEKSDIDIMCVDKEFEVYPSCYDGYYKLSKYCLQLHKSKHTRPGYCLVDVVGERYVDIELYIKKHQQNLHEFFVRTPYSEGKITGPAFTMFTTNHSLGGDLKHNDAVLCFASKHWPAACRNWPNHVTWPSLSLQKSIKREGFHIVKLGHPLSPERANEWRLSFSLAEKMLIQSFNPTQLTCTVVMKWLVNHYIKPVVPDSINSYHIKTLMLWSVEQDIDQKWEPQCFIQCLEKLLSKLMKCISVGKLQHYFIPGNNLFQCKLTKYNRKILFQKVEELQRSVLDKCSTTLPFIGKNISQAVRLKHVFQEWSLKHIAFREFDFNKPFVGILYLRSVCHLMKIIMRQWIKESNNITGQHQLNISLVNIILTFLSWKNPSSNNIADVKLSKKWFSYLKTWFGSILNIPYKLKLIEENDSKKPTNTDEINWRNMAAIGTNVVIKSYENASTTGCIKMSLLQMCGGNHYYAVPLLNRALNMIDKFENYSLFKGEDEIFYAEYNFTEYMHLYNDQQAIESEFTSEFLNDTVLCNAPFIWLEMILLPSLLQLELTHSFYNVDILKLLEDIKISINPFQYWNPIPLTHFLLFICHYELLKSVTFLDPACLQDDIEKLQSLIYDRRRLRQDEVPPVLNLLTWCYLQMRGEKLMVKYAVQCVQQSTGCAKTLFSHLFMQHVIGAVIKLNARCIVS